MDKEKLKKMIKEYEEEIDQIKSERRMLRGKLQRRKQQLQEYQMNLEKAIKEEKQESLTQ